MTRDAIISDAIPSKYFSFPPYKAELFYAKYGWSGVMNRNGFNVLELPDGRTITDYETAAKIAEKWNNV
jgi:hypothetical protein